MVEISIIYFIFTALIAAFFIAFVETVIEDFCKRHKEAHK